MGGERGQQGGTGPVSYGLGKIAGGLGLQDVLLHTQDRASTINRIVDAPDSAFDVPADEVEGTKSSYVQQGLKDLVNNKVFQDIRDAPTTEGLAIPYSIMSSEEQERRQEQAYANPNVVWEPRQMEALSELIISGEKDIEEVLKDDMMELTTQVDTFAEIKKKEDKKERDEKREVREAKKVARKEKLVKEQKVKEVEKKAKVTKSASAQALSRARGNTKDAVKIAKITKSFTAAKKKDPTVYMPTIRRSPSGAWVGGF